MIQHTQQLFYTPYLGISWTHFSPPFPQSVHQQILLVITQKVYLAFVYGISMAPSYSEALPPLCGGTFLSVSGFALTFSPLIACHTLPSYNHPLWNWKCFWPLRLCTVWLLQPQQAPSSLFLVPNRASLHLPREPISYTGPLHCWSLSPGFLLAYCCISQTCKLERLLLKEALYNLPFKVKQVTEISTGFLMTLLSACNIYLLNVWFPH